MAHRTFGFLVAAAVAGALSQTSASAKSDKVPAKGDGKRCVHNCSGLAACKGNGNNSCKGKNSCANEGLVPAACSSQKTESGCLEVKDDKKNKMCSWL